MSATCHGVAVDHVAITRDTAIPAPRGVHPQLGKQSTYKRPSPLIPGDRPPIPAARPTVPVNSFAIPPTSILWGDTQYVSQLGAERMYTSPPHHRPVWPVDICYPLIARFSKTPVPLPTTRSRLPKNRAILPYSSPRNNSEHARRTANSNPRLIE